MSLYNWNKTKSKILEKLAAITPVINTDIKSEEVISSDTTGSTQSNQLSREDTIALVVNKALDGDQEAINNISDKITRGKAKALIIRINRGTAERPPMPDTNTTASAATAETTELSREDTIALVVNKALDGDQEAINNISDKITRGKAKALIIRINRGTAERPPMPDTNTTASAATAETTELSREDTIALVVNKALDGDQEAINNITDKVTRAKAKALLVKINRGAAERPPMPDTDKTSKETNVTKEESDEELIKRLVAAGLDGNMEEINLLDNKVLRGKIKAAIVKAKRKS